MVEKPENFSPNEKLIQARKLRGWNQAKLAELIGAHPKNVSRWECGSTAVSSHYQQKLCKLFKMNAIELGFLSDNSTLTQEKTTPNDKDYQAETTPDNEGQQKETAPDGEEQSDEATPNSEEQSDEATPNSEEQSDEATPNSEEQSDEATPNSEDSSNKIAPDDEKQLDEVVPNNEALLNEDRPNDENPLNKIAPDDQAAGSKERLPLLLDQIQNLVTQLIKKSHQTSSAREKIEDAYQKLLTISLARMTFVHTVEAIRRYNGPVAHERLPQAKKQLDTAEQEFDEDEVSRTLALFDNNRVWPHYVKGRFKFQDYIHRTEDLIEEALEPPSPLVAHVIIIDALLQGNAAKDGDPVTRKLSKDMENELDAMLKAMNKRLRL